MRNTSKRNIKLNKSIHHCWSFHTWDQSHIRVICVQSHEWSFKYLLTPAPTVWFLVIAHPKGLALSNPWPLNALSREHADAGLACFSLLRSLRYHSPICSPSFVSHFPPPKASLRSPHPCRRAKYSDTLHEDEDATDQITSSTGAYFRETGRWHVWLCWSSPQDPCQESTLLHVVQHKSPRKPTDYIKSWGWERTIVFWALRGKSL